MQPHRLRRTGRTNAARWTYSGIFLGISFCILHIHFGGRLYEGQLKHLLFQIDNQALAPRTSTEYPVKIVLNVPGSKLTMLTKRLLTVNLAQETTRCII